MKDIFNTNNWGSIRFGDYCDFRGGKQPPKSTFKYEEQEGYVRLLQIRDFGDREEPVYVSTKNNLTFVEEDDILIARYGASVGKILTGKNGAINVAIIKTLPKTDLIKRYLYWFLKNPKFQKYITSIPGRMAQAGFDKSVLVDVTIPIPMKSGKPDKAKQLEIVKRLDCIEEATVNLHRLLNSQSKNYLKLIQSLLNEVYQ